VIGREASVIPDGTGAQGGYLIISPGLAKRVGRLTAKAFDHSSNHLSLL